MVQHDLGTGNERFSTFPQLTLEVGGVNGPGLKSIISLRGDDISPLAGKMLDSVKNPGEREQVSTVVFPLREVGIRDRVSGRVGWDYIETAIEKAGLKRVPQLAAAETARNHAEFIGEGEWIRFLSKPFTDTRANQIIFVLNRVRGKLKLDGRWTVHLWLPDHLVAARLS